MMLLKALFQIALLGSTCLSQTSRINSDRRDLLQDIVTWDRYSIFVRGERVLFLSGEFHPFRLPSPGLWLDVFQKVKALGFSGVSFYTNWALMEGAPGEFRADGVFALEGFFDAASQSGIYLLARPGPYINSEVSGGGYPGWVSRIKGPIRTNATDWHDATRNYIKRVGAIISKAQITNGGPVILFQPENEYTICADALAGAGLDSIKDLSKCLNLNYMADVEAMWRDAGIVLPYIVNDALPIGNFVPGSGIGAVDIYGYDGYPLGWGTCSEPSNWNRANAIFPSTITNFTIHMEMSPSTPFSIVEFQGGSAEGWGGAGMDSCASLLNNEFERVIYKVVYGFRTTVLNLYMMFGGTNWGNIGHPLGYTSYDVGAAIAEDRQVTREKYSELKLQANFLQVSPAYLTAMPQDGIFANTTKLITTRLAPTEQGGTFYIVRHSDWTSVNTTKYTLLLEASGQNLTIPQLGGGLSLVGRDSKIHVVDYDVSGIRLIYSTAEIFTWKRSSSKTVLLLYGGAGETHEFAVSKQLGPVTKIEGVGIKSAGYATSTIVQWDVEPMRRVVHFGNILEVHLLWRNDAYNYWVLDLPHPEPIGNYISASRINATDASIIVNAGYLIRNASILDNNLHLWGDVNKTTTIEVISSPLKRGAKLYFNEQQVKDTHYVEGRLTGTVTFCEPQVALPDFSRMKWGYLNSLPEIQPDYDDHLWVVANLTTSNNSRVLTTPTSLYASDYGFHTGSLIYRGHFRATGNESSLFLSTSGGNAFSYAVWLNSTYLASWVGDPDKPSHNQTFELPLGLKFGNSYVITVLIDHMGLTENTYIGVESIKEPRGILDYTLTGHSSKSDIIWKLTGNLGGEHYIDLSRGPRNEGALFAERQGYHLPGAPLDEVEVRSPISNGMPGVGVGFFATTFDLDIPLGYDIPMSFTFTNASQSVKGTATPAYRVQLFLNGWQFGKYINNIGPQLSYPVPEGILNYSGKNYLALTLWSLESGGAKLGGLSLGINTVVQSGYSKPSLVEGQVYALRSEAY
ncbi:beta-galactosidase [Bisporella sp. PMI_857]|nr:beta-galactosidase [Bisporella sp. PMI_857]